MSLDIIISIISGLGGATCGWILNAYYGPALEPQSTSASAATPTSPASSLDEEAPEPPSPDRIVQVADQLRHYASSMTADIDAHQTHIKAVNKSLTDESEPTTQAAILAAVNELVAANGAMQQRLQKAQDCISDQSARLESAEKKATTDGLTGIANRRAFDDYLAERHEVGPLKAGVLAVLDVDHFKKFNDEYGHRAGDEVLRVVAKTLEERLSGEGLVARFGGEEFAVILHECDSDRATDLIEQARRDVGRQQIEFEGQELRVSACAGVANLRPGETPEIWLQRADDALYASKDAGRDCGHRMDGSMPIRIELSGSDATEQPPSRTPAESPDVIDQTRSDQTRSDQAASDGEHSASQDSGAAAIDAGLSPETPADCGADPTPFSALPTMSDLRKDFVDMCERTRSVGGAVHLLAVNYNATSSDSMMKSLVQVIRAGARSVDQMACFDERTLVLCLPNSDQALAADRAEQIIKAFESVQTEANEDGTKLVGIGVAEATEGVDFEDVASLASEAARDACSPAKQGVLIVTDAATG